jgi:glycosyltransferase involved in cell wall biosynthesis
VRIAYLTNQYPKVSHTFIRREIVALESEGVEVERYSVRRTNEKLSDPADVAEADQTHVVLDGGVKRLGTAIAKTVARHPLGFVKALKRSVSMGVNSERGVVRHFAYLAEACVLRDWFERESIDHVHVHFGTNSATVALLCKELGGPGYSMTVHGPEEFDKPDLIRLREKLESAEFVAGVSSFGKSQLMRLTNEQEQWEKVHVVRCGVDSQFLEAEPTPVPSDKRLVCVGRLSPQKGQLLLIEAAAQLEKSGADFELVLVGDGELRELIERGIAEHGLEKHVRITGWSSNDEVRREIVAARALVLPSFAEGLPVVIMEALGLGRPVVSTYIAGIPELVETGKNGWLVPAGSVDALVRAMREVLDADPKKLGELGREGQRRVRELHDIRSNARVLRKLIEGAVGHGAVIEMPRVKAGPVDASTESSRSPNGRET